MKNQMTHFDIIGDIHGHAAHLRELLTTLGYDLRDGAHRHPDGRRVLFLGDFIDRGPEIPATLKLVRAMHAAGTALAVPGNHEFNALAYAMPNGRGGFMRKHNGNNVEQHAETLAQFAGREDEWLDHLAWFRTLPLWLELPGLRAVHAAWCFKATAMLGEAARMDDTLVRAASTRGTPEFRAVETLIKGVELPLPDGHFFHDQKRIPRHSIRTRWWKTAHGATFRNLALQPEADIFELPELPTDAHAHTVPGYAEHERPVFNGHYWLTGDAELMAPNVAILDYSVAAGGPLTAYRWDGEQRLDAAKFVQAHEEARN